MSCFHMSSAIFIVLLVKVCNLVNASSSVTSPKVRVVTWNVNDNSAMDNGFSDNAIKKVLGLDKQSSNLPTIYAIGLQENCWMCNVQNMAKLADRFLTVVNKGAGGKLYEAVGVIGTRMSSFCEYLCKFHGTTALIVIAKKSTVKSSDKFRFNHKCSDTMMPNKEKGVAAIKIQLKNGKSLCFGTAHLASGESASRRKCLKGFFGDPNVKISWASCNSEFLFGDFNTRTGDKTKASSGGKYVPKETNFKKLQKADELTGEHPYGTDSAWQSCLLSYINSVQKKKFKEGKLSFMPTYSIKPSKKECNGRFPCYRSNRPMSWTDRIIYTTGRLLEYDAIYEEFGDHFPVYAEFIAS